MLCRMRAFVAYDFVPTIKHIWGVNTYLFLRVLILRNSRAVECIYIVSEKKNHDTRLISSIAAQSMFQIVAIFRS